MELRKITRPSRSSNLRKVFLSLPACQSLSPWERWHGVSRDGEGKPGTKEPLRSDGQALCQSDTIAVSELFGSILALSGGLAPAKAGLRLPASASLSLASCWPLPQQLLPVSAAGGGRRRCPKGGAFFSLSPETCVNRPKTCANGSCSGGGGRVIMEVSKTPQKKEKPP